MSFSTEDDGQAGVAFEDLVEDEVGDRLLDHVAGEGVGSAEALVVPPSVRAAGEAVQADRHAHGLGLGEEGLVVVGLEVELGGRRAPDGGAPEAHGGGPLELRDCHGCVVHRDERGRRGGAWASRRRSRRASCCKRGSRRPGALGPPCRRSRGPCWGRGLRRGCRRWPCPRCAPPGPSRRDAPPPPACPTWRRAYRGDEWAAGCGPPCRSSLRRRRGSRRAGRGRERRGRCARSRGRRARPRGSRRIRLAGSPLSPPSLPGR